LVAAPENMTSATEGFFVFAKDKTVYIKFKEPFDYMIVDGIAKIKGTKTSKQYQK